METITKTKIRTRDFMRFVMEQPAEMKVAMCQSKSESACGCLMVHYGKEMLHLDRFRCGFMDIGPHHALKKSILTIIPQLSDMPDRFTYGELQERIKAQ